MIRRAVDLEVVVAASAVAVGEPTVDDDDSDEDAEDAVVWDEDKVPILLEPTVLCEEIVDESADGRY